MERWRASGLGGKTFAERHGLGYSSLYRWAHVFEDKARVELGFTEVRVRETRSNTSPEAGVIEIVTRTGWMIRVAGAVDVERLRAVLEAVGSC